MIKTDFFQIKFYACNWLSLAVMICVLSGVSNSFFPSIGFIQTANAQSTDDDTVTPQTETSEQMRKRLADEKRKLQAIQSKRKGVNKQVKELDLERGRLNKLLIEYAQRIQKSETNLTSLESKLSNLHNKEDKLRQSMLKRRVAIADMLGLLQRMARNPPPIMATHRDDSLKMVRSAMLMSNILPKLKTQADSLKSELTNLVSLKTTITKQSEQLRIQNAEMESDQLRVKELLQEKNSRILSHNKELQEFEQRAKSHSKSVASLGDLIAKVDLEMKRKTELGAYENQLIVDEKLAKERYGNKAAVELTPDEKRKAFIDPGRIKPALPFGKAKQTLSLPVRGKQLRRFGDKDKYGSASKGISIQTRANAQITSPSDGWIAYAGKFRSYGQLLIINAGGGYHILLAGLDRIDVKTSQFVLAGEPIGVMKEPNSFSDAENKAKAKVKNGKKGGKTSSNPVLYVEFRKDGRPIDPNPWWSGSQVASDQN